MTSPASNTPEILSGSAQRSPLFTGLLEQLQQGSRWVVLDLGTVHAATIELLQPLRCRLEIFDLPAALDALDTHDDDASLGQQFDAILPPAGPRPADVVLCWDLLNYLTLPAVAALMERVATRCRTGTQIHALMMYSHRRIPATPGTYLPCEDGRLILLPGSALDREAPRYSSEQLSAAMPRFRTERAMLLHSGMQELLLVSTA